MVANSTNKEHSRFISELRDSNKTIVKEFSDFKEEVRIYIKEDNAWKDKALPVIEAGYKAFSFGSVTVGLLKFISLFGVVAGMVYAFFKWIK